jgi:hypothetical protein
VMMNIALIIMVFLCVTSSKTPMTNRVLVVMVFFLCATCKTRTTSVTHCPSFICVLQVLKLGQWASWFFLCVTHFETTTTTTTLVVVVIFYCCLQRRTWQIFCNSFQFFCFMVLIIKFKSIQLMCLIC